MDLTHLHLLVNHLPIFGSLLGGLVLAYGIWVKSYDTKIAAYGVLIISAIGAFVAHITGDAAADFVEKLPGFAKEAIRAHDEASGLAMLVLIVLGMLSVVGIFSIVRKWRSANLIAAVALALSLIGLGLVARTGYLGGKIRHTELEIPVLK